VNDLLAEIELVLEATASWPSAATRIVVYGSLLLAACAMLGSAGSVAAAILVVLGLGGAGFCVSIDRRAKALSREQRRAIDALVEALVPRDLLAGERAARDRGGK
jgi:hypothetical protein